MEDNSLQAMANSRRPGRLKLITRPRRLGQVVVEATALACPRHLVNRIFETVFSPPKKLAPAPAWDLPSAHSIQDESTRAESFIKPPRLRRRGVRPGVSRPRRPRRQSVSEGSPPSWPSPPHTPQRKSGKILVLDDEKIHPEMLGEMLGCSGTHPTSPIARPALNA